MQEKIKGIEEEIMSSDDDEQSRAYLEELNQTRKGVYVKLAPPVLIEVPAVLPVVLPDVRARSPVPDRDSCIR